MIEIHPLTVTEVLAMHQGTRYAVWTKVVRVEERFKTEYVSGSGADVVNRQRSLGWFVQFLGSYEMLFLGLEKPDGLETGDTVKITVEKQPVDAQANA